MAKIINIEAMQMWNELPKDLQIRILDNVFCINCIVTTIVEYDIVLSAEGFVLLKGKCEKCGDAVARLVD